ncbi:MAG: murein biosynthesis integral membrane protein MurJ [Anaerolineae bacterium]|nr:murein biosynthesis integral membrane protein MurJ [Anaerolineae bacterium]
MGPAQPHNKIPTLGRIIRSTLIVMVASAAAKAISLAQTVIQAEKFGKAFDTYVAASDIPDLIVIVISGGALVQAFLPVFSDFLATDDKARAWRLASAAMNTVFLAALALGAAAFVLAPWLVPNVLAPGFKDNPEQIALTVELLRILLLASLLFALGGLFMGILQAHQNFFLPALAAVFQDAGLLFGIYFLTDSMGLHGVAWGAVIGAVCYVLVQIPGLIHFGMRWRPVLGWSLPELRLVVRLMIPRVLGLGLVFWFNLRFLRTFLGSQMAEGSITAYDWGWRLMQIPETLLGTALAVVIFPTLATLSSLGDLDGKRRALNGSLRYILAACIPAGFGMMAVGRPLISLLERGEFTAELGDMVYGTLAAFTLGLITHAALEVTARAFYADKDTMTPLYTAVLGASINFVLALALGQLMQAAGLALANSAAMLVEVGALLWLLRRRWQGVGEDRLVRTAVRALGASVVMTAAVLLVQAVMDALGFGMSTGVARTVVAIAAAVIAGGAVYFAAGWALKMEEIRMIPGMVAARLGRERPATEG